MEAQTVSKSGIENIFISWKEVMLRVANCTACDALPSQDPGQDSVLRQPLNISRKRVLSWIRKQHAQLHRCLALGSVVTLTPRTQTGQFPNGRIAK